jgi:hypothetical protein
VACYRSENSRDLHYQHTKQLPATLFDDTLKLIVDYASIHDESTRSHKFIQSFIIYLHHKASTRATVSAAFTYSYMSRVCTYVLSLTSLNGVFYKWQQQQRHRSVALLIR